MKRLLSAFLVCLGFLLLDFPYGCFSHPHVFIENTLTIVFDQKGMAGVRVKWVFDELFSSMITEDYDKNHNGNLENYEIRIIKEKAFSNLKNFDFFTFIEIHGKPFTVQYVREFTASLTKGKLNYEFYIPCHVSATNSFKELKISQYDPSYYTSMTFAQNSPVRLEGHSSYEVHYRIMKNLEKAYYFGQIHPVEVVLKFRLKDA